MNNQQHETEVTPLRIAANIVGWDSTVQIGQYGSRSKGGFGSALQAFIDASEYVSREPGNVTGILIEPVYAPTNSSAAYDQRANAEIAA